MTTWVKICGITRPQDARAAFDCGADAIGINFWPSSRRYCEPERARAIVAALPPASLVYGVFVDAAREEIAAIVRDVGLTGVQLHGHEPAGDEEGWGVPVIRAVAAVSRDVVSDALGRARSKLSDGDGGPGRFHHASGPLVAAGPFRLLIDNAAGGGSGVRVETALLDGLDLGDAILAGGLTPQNVAASVARFRPFGVDTAGGVEASPGIKDPRSIEAFIREARAGTPRHGADTEA